MIAKMKLDLDSVQVESCEVMAPVAVKAKPTETQPVSYPCCYSVYLGKN